MKIPELTPFFGLPAQSAEFDQYLTAHGIAERPVYQQNPTEAIDRPEDGISLIFMPKFGYEKFWGAAREDGEMIFAEIRIYGENNDDSYSGYAHPWPYGLTCSSTLQEAKAVFGEPTLDHPSGDNRVYVWYNFRDEGFSVALCILPDDKGIAFLDLERAKLRAPKY